MSILDPPRTPTGDELTRMLKAKWDPVTGILHITTPVNTVGVINVTLPSDTEVIEEKEEKPKGFNPYKAPSGKGKNKRDWE